MDPWLSNVVKDRANAEGEQHSNSDSHKSLEENSTAEFEDQFVISAQPSFEKLPDSDHYLASLERKLKAVQSGGNKKDTSAQVLRSLEQTRESCMVKLLRDNSATGNPALDNLDFDELKVNPILKRIAPEKQAVALEELVHLVKADQLSILLGAEEDEDWTIISPEEVPQPTTNTIEISESEEKTESEPSSELKLD